MRKPKTHWKDALRPLPACQLNWRGVGQKFKLTRKAEDVTCRACLAHYIPRYEPQPDSDAMTEEQKRFDEREYGE